MSLSFKLHTFDRYRFVVMVLEVFSDRGLHLLLLGKTQCVSLLLPILLKRRLRVVIFMFDYLLLLADLMQSLDRIRKQHNLQYFHCILVLKETIQQSNRILIQLLQLSILLDHQFFNQFHDFGGIQGYQLVLLPTDQFILIIDVLGLVICYSIYFSDVMPQIIIDVVIVQPVREQSFVTVSNLRIGSQ